MSKIEIGIGALLVGIAGAGFGSDLPFNIAVGFLGALLFATGIYEVYVRPNFFLEGTLRRWLKQFHWTVEDNQPAPEGEYFSIVVSDESKRRIRILRLKAMKSRLVFLVRIELHQRVIAGLSRLSAADQQRLYQDIHVLVSTMGLGFRSPDFTRMEIAAELPLDEAFSSHAVSVRAELVSAGYNAVRSLVRRAAISDADPLLP